MLRRLIFSLSIALGLASPVAAQAPDSISLDITVGPSSGSSSRTHYYSPGTAAGEFTLAYGPLHTTGPVYALTVGGNISYSATDVCAIDDAAPGKCKPIFPSTTHIGLLGGYHTGTSHTALQVMVGPVAFGGAGPSGGGGQLSLDGSAGVSHVALLVAVRGQVLRRINGETLYVRSLGLGVRLQ